MQTAVYALTRLILFGFGWIVAAVVALAAEEMEAGTRWPVFAALAGWWTYVCAIYVQREAAATEARREAATQPGISFLPSPGERSGQAPARAETRRAQYP